MVHAEWADYGPIMVLMQAQNQYHRVQSAGRIVPGSPDFFRRACRGGPEDMDGEGKGGPSLSIVGGLLRWASIHSF